MHSTTAKTGQGPPWTCSLYGYPCWEETCPALLLDSRMTPSIASVLLSFLHCPQDLSCQIKLYVCQHGIIRLVKGCQFKTFPKNQKKKEIFYTKYSLLQLSYINTTFSKTPKSFTQKGTNSHIFRSQGEHEKSLMSSGEKETSNCLACQRKSPISWG